MHLSVPDLKNVFPSKYSSRVFMNVCYYYIVTLYKKVLYTGIQIKQNRTHAA